MEDFLTSFFVAPFTGLATGIASATSPLDVIDAVDGFVWGPIMILLLLFTHIFMTVPRASFRESSARASRCRSPRTTLPMQAATSPSSAR